MKYLVTQILRTSALVVLFSGIGTSVRAQSLPVGFVDELVVGGLDLPTAFTALPDGRLLVAEKAGRVRVISSSGQLLATPLIDLSSSVNDYWDRGLLGIAADLNFATNGYVYLLYAYENNAADYTGPKTGRLTRVTAAGNIASPASAFTVLGTSVGSTCNAFPVGADCIPTDDVSHSVGNIKVAPDGTLFVTIGDGASFTVVDDDALRSQNLDLLAGKLLHITPTGQGLPGNPFWNGSATANRSKVWAYGLRNAYRFALDPVSGVPFVGDVGWGEWEEINAANPAVGSVNFGWPCYEGPLVQDGYAFKPTCQALYALGPTAVQMPAVPYGHLGGGAAVTSGVFYSGTSFPALYHDVFFYADYALGFVRYVRVTPAGERDGPVHGFAIDLPGPVYLDTDGQDLLYVSIVGGSIRRIRYTGASPDVSYLSDRAWTSASSGWGPVELDQSNGDNGAEDGRVLSLDGPSYPKGLGVHAPADVRFALNGACSVFAASVGIDDEAGGTVVFQVFTDGVKVFDSGLMNGSSATQIINLNTSGKNELRLVVTNGGDGDADDHADWANARITCAPLDVTPPTVTDVSPPAAGTGVGVFSSVAATFSEAMTASTLTTTTVRLTKQGSTKLVAATVTYSAATNTVTLDPTGNLEVKTSYTATIRGGPGGAKDLANNPLAADRVWTFTTGASNGVVYLSDITWASMTNGWGPVEKDRSNGDLGATDGGPITLNGVTYAKGLGAHAASDLRYALNGACTGLTAVVGVDDEVGTAGSVVFQVWTDGIKWFDSGVVTGTMPGTSISVNIAGAVELALVITDGGNGNEADHGDWANAQVTCGADTTAPTVTATSPVAGATGVAVTTNVTATFSEPMTAATLTTTTVKLVRQGTTTPVAAAVTYDGTTRIVTLNPTADLATSTAYTATITGGSAGAKDLAGNPLVADKVWTFTTAATGATTSYLSDLLWTSMTNGWGPVEKDRSNGNLGATDGGPITLNGVTYAKGLGAHAASDVRYALNGLCSVLTAVVGVDDAVGAAGSLVFQVWTDGVKRYDSGVMTGTMPGTSINVTMVGATELALLITDAGNGNAFDHGDWANAQLSCGTDTTAPTVPTVTPVAGATGVVVTANVMGTFSEAMNAATLTPTTVTLVRQGTTTPVAAAVTYDGTTRTVTLNPTADLATSTAYTATIAGGSAGAKDLAGNPLAADKVWTFTTAAAGTTGSYLSDWTWTSMTNGWGPVEKDRSNGNLGATDGGPITLNGVTYAKGLGAHAASDVRYALNGLCSVLTAVVGVDDAVGAAGSVVFQVWTDGVKRYDSGVMTGMMPGTSINVNVVGATELALLITDGGNGNAFDHGDWANAQLSCTANTPPVATISQPLATFKFSVGDVITYAGSGTDREDGVLTGSRLSWSIVLFHCPGGSCHVHPFTNGSGTTGMFIAPDHGDDSYFEITLSATDSGGLVGTTSVTIQPETVQLTLATVPTGLQVVYGGITATSPATFTTIVGATHTIQAPSPQGALSFSSWSDGGPQQHNVVVGSTNATYVATFSNGTAPTVMSVNPPGAAPGVSVFTSVTATFSEAMTASTLTTTTVRLVPQGSTTLVPATVTYAAGTNTVTLDPTSSLTPGTVYTATIRGGASGVKDLSNTPLTADIVWTFTTSASGSVYLSDLTWTSMTNGWGAVEKDRSNGDAGATDGGPIRLNGVTYAKGLGAHAASNVRYALNGACSRLTATVGVDDEMTAGSIVFQVWTDGVKKYDSGTMTGTTASANLNVSLAGAMELALIITDAGNGNEADHGDWANAQMTCGSGFSGGDR